MKFFFLLFLPMTVFGFDWQGHRGARGLYPENTIGAMRESLKYPVTTFELDVVVTKDHQVLVSHEPWMNPDICVRPDGKPYKVKDFNLYKMTYEEILKFDCGSKRYPRFPDQAKVSERKPLLRTLIEEMEGEVKKLQRPMKYNIEIKSTEEDEKAGFQPSFKAMTDTIMKTVRGLLPDNRYVVQSFDKRVLKYLAETYPSVTLSLLEENSFEPEAYLKALGFTPKIFSPDYTLLNPEKVKIFHTHGIEVIPWTVNSVPDMKMLMSMGVDGIITDYPNLIPLVTGKTCSGNENLFEGKCVTVPTHAVPSPQNPGWVCNKGYVQRWKHCEKIAIPANADFLDDGKTWNCKTGYEKYRDTCRKK